MTDFSSAPECSFFIYNNQSSPVKRYLKVSTESQTGGGYNQTGTPNFFTWTQNRDDDAAIFVIRKKNSPPHNNEFALFTNGKMVNGVAQWGDDHTNPDWVNPPTRNLARIWAGVGLLVEPDHQIAAGNNTLNQAIVDDQGGQADDNTNHKINGDLTTQVILNTDLPPGDPAGGAYDWFAELVPPSPPLLANIPNIPEDFKTHRRINGGKLKKHQKMGRNAVFSSSRARARAKQNRVTTSGSQAWGTTRSPATSRTGFAFGGKRLGPILRGGSFSAGPAVIRKMVTQKFSSSDRLQHKKNIEFSK